MGHKTCFKCLRKLPLSQFYKHPNMGDGHLNKCKECTKNDVRRSRRKRIDYYRAYDRSRGGRRTTEDLRKYRKQNPEKYAAHCAVANALKGGKLERKPCEICGTTSNLHAHHDDYSKPLEIRWLCAAHHHQHHSKYQ